MNARVGSLSSTPGRGRPLPGSSPERTGGNVMPEPATVVPSQRPELVSWPAGDEGDFLVRNRRTGETFQLGEQEHFLLERLDGRHDAGDIRAAFTGRFGEPLSEEELA